MSFDLYVFDLDQVPDSDEAIGALLEDDSRWGAPLTPRLAAFVAELEDAYPGLDGDPDSSPWASWPLDSGSMVDGRCCGFNIAWSAADAMSGDMRRRAQRHGLTLHDPQTGEIIGPSSATPRDGRRRLFRRGDRS